MSSRGGRTLRCVARVAQSGQVASTERWLGWLEAQGAMERNAAVAALGAAVASTRGRLGGGGASSRWRGNAAATQLGTQNGAPRVDRGAAVGQGVLVERAAPICRNRS
jgi:hypothetical protein